MKVFRLSGVIIVTLVMAACSSEVKEPQDGGLQVLNNNYPYCQGQLADNWGSATTGSDTIFGTSGDDVLHGWWGNDTIYGQGGNDIICGGDGRDTIFGGPGRDDLFGNETTMKCAVVTTTMMFMATAAMTNSLVVEVTTI